MILHADPTMHRDLVAERILRAELVSACFEAGEVELALEGTDLVDASIPEWIDWARVARAVLEETPRGNA